jgi:hypothetical protein
VARNPTRPSASKSFSRISRSTRRNDVRVTAWCNRAQDLAMAFDMRRAAGEKGADFGRQRRIGHPPNWPTPAHWRIGASGGGTGGHARRRWSSAASVSVPRVRRYRLRRRDTARKIGLDISDSHSHAARVDSRNACRQVLMEPTAGRRSARGLPTGALEQPNSCMDDDGNGSRGLRDCRPPQARILQDG